MRSCSLKFDESTTFWINAGNRTKKKDPNNGPNTVPAPPIITIAMNVIEYNKLKVPGSAPPKVVISKAPATPP